MEINWTMLSYVVIAIFAIVGFYRGWWREAIIFVFLAVLIFLLLNPTIAQWIIEQVNAVIVFIWDLIPGAIKTTLGAWLDAAFAVNTGGGPPQINPTDGATWIIILTVFMVMAILIGRGFLGANLAQTGVRYAPTCLGSVFGGLLGALNGLIILNLIREYLDGRNLPGGALPTDISQASGNIGVSASSFALRISDIPQFTILDSFIPWIFVGTGALLIIILLRNRVRFVKSSQGFRRIDRLKPYGYKEIDVKVKG
ncbi:MAG: hypothetical protein H6631_15305 [Anaerolineaceae bacterium]|nr:hypothetical protein [Anaerolineaceae bacterium]MCB9102169.1 hypothetical protein [Anaerolineales bacterium]